MAKAAIGVRESSAEQAFSVLRQIAIVVGASAVIAVCARLMLPLPFTPVPLTLANFGVLLVGLTLGSRRGFRGRGALPGLGRHGIARLQPSRGRAASLNCWGRPLVISGPIR